MKRKASTAGMTSSGRPVKRRASKACHCCRSRKVRCDVVESGIPCTNCRLDDVECVVTEGKRRRKSYAENDLVRRSPSSPNMTEDSEPVKFPIFDDIDGLHDLEPAQLDGMESCSHSDSVEKDCGHHKPHMLCMRSNCLGLSAPANETAIDQTQGHRLSVEEREIRISAISTSVKKGSVASSVSGGFINTNAAIQPLEPHLPSYIRPIPARFLREDVEFLQRKGALSIPEVGFRNELLRNYVQFVHPYLPILDLESFLSSIERNDAKVPVSLLLFQAVMFTATAYIDIRYLHAQGYETRKAARKAFFQRVKLLYDFDYENDRITVIQAVLLMTYWFENPDDPKDIWHWLGIAVSLAKTIGLGCNTDNTPMDPARRSLWKRIWWSCYMRDRLVAIGMRRPMRIGNDEFDISMLTLEDFDTKPLSAELSRMLGGCPAVRDEAKRVTLAKMCIEMIKVCKIITCVLRIQYSVLGHRLGASHETTMRLVPKATAADPSDVIGCDQNLQTWYRDLDADLRYFSVESGERASRTDGDVVHLHRAILTGVYMTGLSALHRPQVMPASPSQDVAPELRELSRRKTREAANKTTEIFQDLYARDLVRYLPNTGVTVLLPAMIIYLLDAKSNDSQLWPDSLRKFQFCMQVLQRLREMYASADFAFSFLDAAIRKTSLPYATSTRPPKPALNTSTFATAKVTADGTLLTPPPEIGRGANPLLYASTLAPEERKLLEAFSPPTSDHSLNAVMTGESTLVLADFDGIGRQEHEYHEYSSEDDEYGVRDEFWTEAVPENVQEEFDALINIENGDLFAGEGEMGDFSLKWWNGLTDEKPTGLETRDLDTCSPIDIHHNSELSEISAFIADDMDKDRPIDGGVIVG